MCGLSEQLPGGGGCTLHARSGKVRWPAIVNGRFGVGSRAAPPRIRQAGAASLGRSATWIPSGFHSFLLLRPTTRLGGRVVIFGGHGDSSLLSGSCSVPRLSSTFRASFNRFARCCVAVADG